MLKLSFVLEAIDKATAPVRRFNKLINSITAPARRVRASLADLGREAGLPRLANAVGQVRSRFGGLMRDLRGLRTGFLYVAGAAAAIAYPLKRTIDSASQINDTAAMLGLTARDLQRVSYALTLDGSSMEDASTSLRFLQRNAVEAITGSEEMATWFRRAGISADFLRKNLKDPKALLYAFADGLKRQKTPAHQLTLAQALLGRSGGKLVQALARGSQELDRLGDEAERLGAVLDDAAVAAMDDAGDSITRVEKSLYGLTTVIASAALPVVQDIAKSIIAWVQANRDLIKTKAAEFFEELRTELPKIWKGIKAVTAALLEIGKVINSVAQFFGGWENVLKAIAVLITAKVIVSIAQLALAIKSLSLLMLTTPFGLFLTGLGALTALGITVYNRWNRNLSVFQNLKLLLEDTILLLDALTPKWSKYVSPISRGIINTAEQIRRTRAVAGMSPINTGGILGERAAPAAGSVMFQQKQPIAVGGLLRVEIAASRDLRPFVREFKSDNADVPIEVSFGPLTAVPR